MRDIETLLREATEVIGKDDAAQQEWIDSLTDEEKALISMRFNALMERVMTQLCCFRTTLMPVLDRIQETIESLEQIKGDGKQARA